MRAFLRTLSLFILITLSCAISADTTELRAGDVLYIALPGEEALNKEFQVDRQGELLLPEVGEVPVAGLALADARARVRQALAEIYLDLSRLEIYLQERRLLVSVLGYVSKPGLVNMPADGGIQTAISLAGGLMAGAQLDRMQVRRDAEVLVFDYKHYLDSGDVSALPALQPLDILFVPASPMIGNVQMDFDAATFKSSGDAAEDKDAIKVFGEVNSPGSFSWREGATLVDILMRAGGVTRYAGVEQIRVITAGKPLVFNLKQYLDSGDSALLPDIVTGATIFVPMAVEEVKTGSRTVYIMGEVKKPGAYESKPDATFMDILANAGGPTRFAETRQIRILRANGSVEPFDLQGYTEGIASVSIPGISPGDAIFVPEKTDLLEKSWLKVSPNRAVRIIGAINAPGRYEWSDEMSLLDLIAHAGGPNAHADIAHINIQRIDGDGSNRFEVFNLESYLKSEAKFAKLPRVSAGTTVMVPELPQDPSDNKARWVRQPAENSIYVFGQVNAPGRYMFNRSMNFLDILAAADGPTANADIHNIRVSHRNGPYTRVSRLNLALYFETGDDSLLPVVAPGDTLYIPEKGRNWLDESKESTVRVLGAVNKPGRYRFDDRMTILDLLAEAGGTTADAYRTRILIVNTSCCEDQARSFDLMAFAKQGDFDRLPVLRAGDTVIVPDKSSGNWEKLVKGFSDIFKVLGPLALLGLL